MLLKADFPGQTSGLGENFTPARRQMAAGGFVFRGVLDPSL
jgi:hypothetical protein